MIGRFLTFFLFLIFSTAALAAQEGPDFLTLLTEENDPFTYYEPQKNAIGGPGTDIVRALMEETGIEYTLSILPWQRAFRRAMAEKNTCAFLANRTPEREPLFQWISPIIMGGWAVYKRSDSDIEITTTADLQQYNVVGKRDGPAALAMEKEANISVIAAITDESAVRLLYHGRADLWITGINDGPVAAQKTGLPRPQMALFWKPTELSLICSKNTEQKLIEALDVANQARLLRLKETVAGNDTPKTPGRR